jgi:hypothetical protein
MYFIRDIIKCIFYLIPCTCFKSIIFKLSNRYFPFEFFLKLSSVSSSHPIKINIKIRQSVFIIFIIKHFLLRFTIIIQFILHILFHLIGFYCCFSCCFVNSNNYRSCISKINYIIISRGSIFSTMLTFIISG